MATDMITDRFNEDWQEYRCSDCDPDHRSGEEGEDEVYQWDQPYTMLVPEGEAVPIYCPRCQAHLSLCDGSKGLRITNTPAERWAADRAAEAAAATESQASD